MGAYGDPKTPSNLEYLGHPRMSRGSEHITISGTDIRDLVYMRVLIILLTACQPRKGKSLMSRDVPRLSILGFLRICLHPRDVPGCPKFPEILSILGSVYARDVPNIPGYLVSWDRYMPPPSRRPEMSLVSQDT